MSTNNWHSFAKPAVQLNSSGDWHSFAKPAVQLKLEGARHYPSDYIAVKLSENSYCKGHRWQIKNKKKGKVTIGGIRIGGITIGGSKTPKNQWLTLNECKNATLKKKNNVYFIWGGRHAGRQVLRKKKDNSTERLGRCYHYRTSDVHKHHCHVSYETYYAPKNLGTYIYIQDPWYYEGNANKASGSGYGLKSHGNQYSMYFNMPKADHDKCAKSSSSGRHGRKKKYSSSSGKGTYTYCKPFFCNTNVKSEKIGDVWVNRVMVGQNGDDYEYYYFPNNGKGYVNKGDKICWQKHGYPYDDKGGIIRGNEYHYGYGNENR